MPEPSRIIFGTAALGMAYGLPRQGAGAASLETIGSADAAQLVELALGLGIDTYDTAPAYGDSEVRLGATLNGRGRLWTKLGRHPRLSTDLPIHAEEEIRASLERLQRPRIDLVQWHNWTADLAGNTEFRACWSRLERLEHVGALGASTYGPSDALAAVESGLFSVVQVEWNVLNQGVVRAITDAAAKRSVRIAIRSVFLQGALTAEFRSLPPIPELGDGVRKARDLAGTLGLSLTELALRAALDAPGVAHVLVGFDRPEQIREATRIEAGPPLTRDAQRAIQALDLGANPASDPRTWRFARTTLP